MQLHSKECDEMLKKYEVKNYLEELAIEVLLAEDEDVYLPKLLETTDKQLDDIQYVIEKIRNDIGIEKEA